MDLRYVVHVVDFVVGFAVVVVADDDAVDVDFVVVLVAMCVVDLL